MRKLNSYYTKRKSFYIQLAIALLAAIASWGWLIAVGDKETIGKEFLDPYLFVALAAAISTYILFIIIVCGRISTVTKLDKAYSMFIKTKSFSMYASAIFVLMTNGNSSNTYVMMVISIVALAVACEFGLDFIYPVLIEAMDNLKLSE